MHNNHSSDPFRKKYDNEPDEVTTTGDPNGIVIDTTTNEDDEEITTPMNKKYGKASGGKMRTRKIKIDLPPKLCSLTTPPM